MHFKIFALVLSMIAAQSNGYKASQTSPGERMMEPAFDQMYKPLQRRCDSPKSYES